MLVAWHPSHRFAAWVSDAFLECNARLRAYSQCFVALSSSTATAVPLRHVPRVLPSAFFSPLIGSGPIRGGSMSSTQLPLEYLVTSSEDCLEGFELARLNQISNLRKEFSQVFDEWVEAEIAARMARWVLAGRRSQGEGASIERLASTRGTSREVPASASDLRHARLFEAKTKSRRRRDSKDSLTSGSDTFLQADLFDESNREFHAPLDRESKQSVPHPAIAPDAGDALEILEHSTARDLRRFRYRCTRAKEPQRKSANRNPMLRFPVVQHSDASAVLAARTALETSAAVDRVHDKSKTPACRKVLSLSSVRWNLCSG